MIPEDKAWEAVSEDLQNLVIQEEVSTKPVYRFNFNAAPYQPSPVASIPEFPPKLFNDPINVLPNNVRVTKKTEEIETNRNKIIATAKLSKEIVNIVFIGHVDAGKSTIGGHILFLTGMVDKRTLEKYEKEAKEKNRESWYFSWALDTNAEEREKGKTVEVGKAFFETNKKRFILLDAPGHRAYVPNMISGAAQADVSILVISARTGEFETGFDKGGQTREHAQIAKIFGTKHLIVVVNKMDDPTVNWSEERFKLIVDRLTVYLKKLGWKLSEITFMPISGYTGANLKEPLTPDVCSWWLNKPSFLQYLDELPPINEDVEGNPMMVISEKYKDMGPVCIGKVISGWLTKNDTFVIMPIQKNVKISTITSHDDEEQTMAKIGDNIQLRLAGADEKDLLSGYVLCTPDHLCPVGKIIDAQLIITECRSIMSAGFKSIIHIHSAVDEVTFTAIKKVMDRKTQTWLVKPPRFVKQDSICVVRLTLNNVQCVAPFTLIPYLGRFSLRDEDL
ncbi:hypothetical protein MXB_4389 [Myxobolus squamalis]|nr:hypothetical protein MXB_4389 [Myxobolus squamalis]